jgi:hypothetical protein
MGVEMELTRVSMATYYYYYPDSIMQEAKEDNDNEQKTDPYRAQKDKMMEYVDRSKQRATQNGDETVLCWVSKIPYLNAGKWKTSPTPISTFHSRTNMVLRKRSTESKE